MKIKKEKFEDHSGQGPYVGWNFTFENDSEMYCVSIDKLRIQTAFYSTYKRRYGNKFKRKFTNIPYENQLFQESMKYLMQNEGVNKIMYLTDLDGYLIVNPKLKKGDKSKIEIFIDRIFSKINSFKVKHLEKKWGWSFDDE